MDKINEININGEIEAIFDPLYYSRMYMEQECDFKMALAHYMKIGAHKKFDPNPCFITSYYLNQLRDKDKVPNALLHYITNGAKCGITPHPLFDAVWYCQNYSIDPELISPFSHFMISIKKGMPNQPNEFFDISWYAERYKLPLHGIALNHYWQHAFSGSFDPGPRFSTSQYMSLYPDIKENGLNPLAHYIYHGKTEGRLALPADFEIGNDYVDNLMKLISKADIIHFHHTEKFANSTIKFMNEHFREIRNAHLILRVASDDVTKQPFPKGENVMELFYSALNPDLLKGKKLIFHSLIWQQHINFLFENPYLLKQSYWMVWGGDVYGARRDEKNDFVRKNIYGIGTFSDRSIISEVYGTNHKFFDTNLCVNPVSLSTMSHYIKYRNPESPVIIQINHSADKSTIEMFKILGQFKNRNIRIKTVLAYSDLSMVSEIRRTGQEIFGDKFSSLDHMLTPDQYAAYLAENDILILNQARQQGTANCCMALGMGQKVFVPSNVSTWDWLKGLGIIAYDTLGIKNMSFEDIIGYPETIRKINMERINDSVYGADAIKKAFMPVFADCLLKRN